MSLRAQNILGAQDVFETSTTKLHPIGTLVTGTGDKIYSYTLNGAVALAAGVAVITPARVANHTEQAVAVAAVGATQVDVTIGATALTADQYLDGFLDIVVAPGIGQHLRIRAHTTSAAGSTVVTAYLAEPLTVALTAASKASFVYNRNTSVVVHPGGASTFVCAGVTTVPVAANAYFWAQTGGPASVLSDGIIAKATGFILTANAVPGAVTTEAAATVTQRLGFAPEATVDAKYYPVTLAIDRG